MAGPPVPTGPTSEDDRSGAPGLAPAERWLAGVVGTAGVVTGGVGVFLSDNQAGTTAILLLGAVFLVMAVQGTAVTKAGKDSVELERRREKARDLSSRAADELDQQNLSAAAAYQDAAKAVDPSIGRDPYVRHVDAQIYELKVNEAVRRVVDGLARASGRKLAITMSRQLRDVGGDILIEDADQQSCSVAVVIKKGTSHIYDPDQIRGMTEPFRFLKDGAILVTDAPVADYAIQIIKDVLPSDLELESVCWVGPADDRALEVALTKLLRITHA